MTCLCALGFSIFLQSLYALTPQSQRDNKPLEKKTLSGAHCATCSTNREQNLYITPPNRPSKQLLVRHLLHPPSPFQITFAVKIPIPALPKKLPQSSNTHVNVCKLAMTSGIGSPTHSATYEVAEVEIKRPHPFCSEV